MGQSNSLEELPECAEVVVLGFIQVASADVVAENLGLAGALLLHEPQRFVDRSASSLQVSLEPWSVGELPQTDDEHPRFPTCRMRTTISSIAEPASISSET